MFEYPKTLITMKMWQFLSFGEFFSSWMGEGFVIKLVAAKVIHQHMFFFTLSLLLDNNLWNNKRYDSLSPRNPDKMPNVTPVQHFCDGFGILSCIDSSISIIYT